MSGCGLPPLPVDDFSSEKARRTRAAKLALETLPTFRNRGKSLTRRDSMSAIRRIIQPSTVKFAGNQVEARQVLAIVSSNSATGWAIGRRYRRFLMAARAKIARR